MKEIISDKFSVLFGSDGYLKLANFFLKNNFKKILVLTDENTKVHCLDLFFSKIKKIDKKIGETILSSSYNFSVKSGESSKNLKTSKKYGNFLLKMDLKEMT